MEVKSLAITKEHLESLRDLIQSKLNNFEAFWQVTKIIFVILYEIGDSLSYPDEEEFLMRFLRAKDFKVDSAFGAVR